MKHLNNWTKNLKHTITGTKKTLSKLSVTVRSDQYKLFKSACKPNKTTTVLDVGACSEELLPDSNLFEKLFPYPKNLTIATIEDNKKLQKLYPESKVIRVKPGIKLPFKDKQFDVATSWATIEHVGNYIDQSFFLNELQRVSKKVFITTPYRGCPYEPHSGTWFIHWLPLSIFRRFCIWRNQPVFADPKNLNPLFINDIKKMKLSKKINLRIYSIFNILPSHLIISSS